MHTETIYLMAENGRFVCTSPYGDVTIKKDRADESCRLHAVFGGGDSTVSLYSPATERYWNVAPDLATPLVDDLVTARKDGWTEFSYAYNDDDPTLMTLRNGQAGYVSRIDIGRPHEHLAASTANAEEAARFRVIRFADEAK
ncbi:hypothetical protein [Trinickia soli]|uniref:hypothetical protein n=1 Tax=Trinickia soli TaxID=380675 RepID=UPI003FA3AFD8